MHAGHRAGLGIAGMLLVSGCRTATRIAEVPRVDLELEGGNRGYLLGRPPEAAPLKPTRQMVQTDIEITGFATSKRAAGETQMNEEPLAHPALPTSTGPAPGPFDTYVAQKGDSLWSIAARPEVYGKATRWRALFEANRDVLKNPDALRPGMTIKIPRDAGQGTEVGLAGEGSTSFKK